MRRSLFAGQAAARGGVMTFAFTDAPARQLQVSDFQNYPSQARQLAEKHVATLRTLPLVFAAMLLREMIGYDWLFPAERAELDEQLTLLQGTNELRTAAEGFASIPLSSELQSMAWAAEPERFSEKLTAYLWASHHIDAFRTIAGAYGE